MNRWLLITLLVVVVLVIVWIRQPLSTQTDMKLKKLFSRSPMQIRNFDLATGKYDLQRPFVFSLATDYNVGLHNMTESLETYGYQYEILGFGEKWGGWSWRLQKHLEAVNRIRQLNPSAVCLFIDAYDAFFIRNEEELITKFRSLGRMIVTGAEKVCLGKNCGRVNAWWTTQNSTPGEYQYLNAGFVIGEAAALETMYDWILEEGYQDDQIGMAAYANRFPLQIGLDTEQLLVTNKAFGDSTSAMETAYALHFPGSKFLASIFSINDAASMYVGTKGLPKYSSLDSEPALRNHVGIGIIAVTAALLGIGYYSHKYGSVGN
jgi:hypothetical protein